MRISDWSSDVCSSDLITELRRRESELRSIGEELRHKNVLLDAALDNMAQGLAMFDVNQRLIICNQRFLDLYNLPAVMAQPGTELTDIPDHTARARSEERRVGKACVSTCRSRGSRVH